MNTLSLPADLSEKRKVLEDELSKVVIEMVTSEIKNEVKTICKENNLEIESVSWEFHGEYDDEGGTAYYPSDINIAMNDERDPEEIEVEVRSKYSDNIYTTNLREIIVELLHDHSDDLYEYDIEEILF